MKKKLSLILVIAMLISLFSLMGALALDEAYTNIAKGAPYTYSTPYTDVNTNSYVNVDGRELTDGVKASSIVGTEWIALKDMGDSVSPYYISINFGKQKTGIKKLSIQSEEKLDYAIGKPASIKYSVSDDDITYTELGEATATQSGYLYDYSLVLNTAVSGRYFRAVITKGDTLFTFISEFEIFVEGTVDVSDTYSWDTSSEDTSSDDTSDVPEVDDGLIKLVGNKGCSLTDDYLLGVPLNTKYSNFLSLLSVTDGVVVKKSSGEVKTSGLIATGDIIERKVNSTVTDSKIIVIDGDVNGDGKVTSNDYLMIKRAFLGTYTLSGNYHRAACISDNTNIKSSDYLKVKRQFLNTYNIHEKYEKDLLDEYPMTFTSANLVLYRMNCTYEGKPYSLTFDKKTWGTWNIGTLSYNSAQLAGFGTDWEYVYRSSQTSSGPFEFTGGNHGSESLVEIKFYNGITNKELKLAVGKSVDIKNLMIVEKTKINFANTTTSYCDVTRTYHVAGNKITLDVDYNYTLDSYFTLSYTCMFPVHKEYGQTCKFINIDNTTKTVSTGLAGTSTGSQPNSNAAKCTIWGYANPSYKFDVEVYTIKNSCDDFKNTSKTFFWDMNTSSNKLYFSKFDSITPTCIKAGTSISTKSSWTFYIDPIVTIQ